MRVDFSQPGLDLLRQEYLIGKCLPMKGLKQVLKLDLGIIWESAEQYTGRLITLNHPGVTAVLRPNIEF
jgi:hypothetical protein